MRCALRTFTVIGKEMTIWQKWWQLHRYDGQRWCNFIGYGKIWAIVVNKCIRVDKDGDNCIVMLEIMLAND